MFVERTFFRKSGVWANFILRNPGFLSSLSYVELTLRIVPYIHC